MVPIHTCQMVNCQELTVLSYCKKTSHWGGHLVVAEKDNLFFKKNEETFTIEKCCHSNFVISHVKLWISTEISKSQIKE